MALGKALKARTAQGLGTCFDTRNASLKAEAQLSNSKYCVGRRLYRGGQNVSYRIGTRRCTEVQ